MFNMESWHAGILKAILVQNLKGNCDNDEDVQDNIDETIAGGAEEKRIDYSTGLQCTFFS